jgi:hypothetical protein
VGVLAGHARGLFAASRAPRAGGHRHWLSPISREPKLDCVGALGGPNSTIGDCVVAHAAGPQPSVVADEPQHTERQHPRERGQRQDVDHAVFPCGRRAPDEHEERDAPDDEDADIHQVEAVDQHVGAVTRVEARTPCRGGDRSIGLGGARLARGARPIRPTWCARRTRPAPRQVAVPDGDRYARATRPTDCPSDGAEELAQMRALASHGSRLVPTHQAAGRGHRASGPAPRAFLDGGPAWILPSPPPSASLPAGQRERRARSSLSPSKNRRDARYCSALPTPWTHAGRRGNRKQIACWKRRRPAKFTGGKIPALIDEAHRQLAERAHASGRRRPLSLLFLLLRLTLFGRSRIMRDRLSSALPILAHQGVMSSWETVSLADGLGNLFAIGRPTNRGYGYVHS